MQLKLHAINSLPERRLRQDLSSSWKDPLWFDSHKSVLELNGRPLVQNE